MKDRAKQILEYIIEKNGVTASELIDQFGISRRTLYYDIDSINYYIKEFGEIKNINHEFSYKGDYIKLHSILFNKENKFFNNEYRKIYILDKILKNEHITIEDLTNKMWVSKNTVVQTIEEIKKDLKNMNLNLEYNQRYTIVGDEYKIRELFILMMQEDHSILNNISDNIYGFDKKFLMKLTDYSLANLSNFVDFVNRRICDGNNITSYKHKTEVMEFDYYNFVKELIVKDASEDEVAYLCAYISTLPNLNSNDNVKIIEEWVNKLIYKFEINTAIIIENKDEFKKNIKRHLLSSYYRIKFGFPIQNPLLNEIKSKHESLYKIVKTIVENKEDFPGFIGIRDEEIGFIVAYLGGYLRGSRDSGARKNKILVVCPNGLTISKSLEIQLYKYIPGIDIVGVMSIKELNESSIYYDYIISTIEIPDKENVIVVNPLLTTLDIHYLTSKLVKFNHNNSQFNIELIMQTVKKNATVVDEDKLKEALIKIINKIYEKEIYQPMLKELINENRIMKIKSVENWEEAVRVAAKPLLEDDSIEPLYVDEMIESIHKHGPYIVLADRFALPHATAKNGVNRLSMSLLVVEEEVDLLGKPVNIFMVLASIDNSSHIKALASLSEMLYEQENIEAIINGDKKSILELIDKNS